MRGSSKVVDLVAGLKKKLGIYELAQFIPNTNEEVAAPYFRESVSKLSLASESFRR